MNDELRALCEEDIADARNFRAEESFLASQARRGRVVAIIAATGLHDAADYYHAARIFQHGEGLEHWAQAHLMARTAADLGYPGARYMADAAHDRWLMRQGKPQKYGTNSIFDGQHSRIWDYDPATTDEQRAAWDVPPLAELIARTERLNDQPREHTLRITTVEVQNLPITIFDLGGPGLPPGIPIHGAPDYEPLRADDPRPTDLPPGLTLWRFGKLFCAKDQDGYPLITWHHCGWQIDGTPDPAAPAALLRALGRKPQWMSAASAFWQRLGLVAGPDTCWLMGGRLPREELARIVLGLYERDR